MEKYWGTQYIQSALRNSFINNVFLKNCIHFYPNNRPPVFKNFFVNYEINLLKYEHNFNTAKKLAANPVKITSSCKQQQQSIF